jgi:dephospho-CoA kinase
MLLLVRGAPGIRRGRNCRHRPARHAASRMLKLGITGGIGCGKSAAARCVEAQGFRRLDSDQIVRERLLTAPDVIAALRDHFGPEILQGGIVDRPALAARVFPVPAEREWLEALLHPRVTAAWAEAFAGGGAGTRWVVEVPLLFEKGLEKWFDFTVCVALSPPVQLMRVVERGLSPEMAAQRIRAQWPQGRKIELADFVLWNDGAPEFLEAQAGRLVRSLPPA